MTTESTTESAPEPTLESTVQDPVDQVPTTVTPLSPEPPTQPVVPQLQQQGFAPPSAQLQPQPLPQFQPQPLQMPQQPVMQSQPLPMLQPQQQQQFPQQAPYGFPGYGQVPQQYQSMPLPLITAPPPLDAAAAKRKQRRRLMVVGAVVVLALIGAGMYVLLSGRSGDSVVAEVTCKPTTLSSCLIKAPNGAVQLTAGGNNWPQLTTASPDQYAADFVTDVPGVGEETQGLLQQDGLKTIVHNDWNAVDGDNVDIVLLSFTTQKGAQDWNSTRAAEILAEYSGTNTPIPGDATGAAHAAVKADSKGNYDAAYTAVVGRMVMDVAYSSPNQLSTPDLRNWAGTELASLKTEPAPAADPAPTAPGTQQVACGSGLQSCLMAVPGNGTPWSSPSDSKWVSSASLTSSQFVSLFWDGQSAAQQQTVLSNFAADGVTGIAHEDWTVNSGYEQADIYLIQTITAAGASSLNTSNFGEPQWGSGLSGVSYTVPNASGTQAWYTNKTDSNGFIDFAYTTNVGNVIVMGWLYFYGSFDSGTTNSWVAPQLSKVQGTEQTSPVGLLPLNQPNIAAANQGSCPSSGNCLIALPSGATDTTSSSYQGTEALTAAGYADRYETTASADVNTWLMSDGFVSGQHRSWTASNGVTADAVLLKYGTPAQAQAAALFDYGANAANNRVCTNTALSDSFCITAPVSATDLLQKETVRILAWKGDYEVGVSVTTSDLADLTQAYGWAQQQLNMLPAN